MLAFAGMVVAIVLTLFVRLGHELFVYVQRSFGIVFLGATYHVFTTDGVRAGSQALNLYMAVPRDRGGRRVRLPLGAREPPRPPPQVPGRRGEPARRVRDRGRHGAARPAAHVHARAVPLRQLPRALQRAVSAVPAQPVPPLLDHLGSRRADGCGSRSRPSATTRVPCATLEPGTAAVVEGPYGSFSSRDLPNDRQVWVAGGIGVTPFLSMARSLNGDGTGRRLLLLRRARARSPLPRRDPFDRPPAGELPASPSCRATGRAS